MSLIDRMKSALGMGSKDEPKAPTPGAGTAKKPAPQMWFSARAYALVETIVGWAWRSPDAELDADALRKIRTLRKREKRETRFRLAGRRLLWDSGNHGMASASRDGYTRHPRAKRPAQISEH